MPEVVLPDYFQLITLESVDSTNEEIKRRAERGAADGTLVWAREQTSGRGRRGREWTSPRGNLYCSLLLRPSCSASKATQLGFVTAAAVAEAITEALSNDAPTSDAPTSDAPSRDARVTCKWPNDVLVNGGKVAGILIESSSAGGTALDWLAIGVGVNVASHPRLAESRFPATSLAVEGAREVTPPKLLECYCRCLQRWISTWHEHGFAAIRDAWLHRAHGLHEPILVRLENETFEGVFAGMDQDGALVLEQNGVDRLVRVGDVFPMSAGRAG
jgi:BirA family transcriptional regulator, biotin operon repressor / biotin---[acetyl-CoA-carboxylase] ligase